MNWLLALILKPFVAVVLIMVALGISRLIHRVMPDSRLKRWLFSPLPWYRGRRRG
jgi:hypothetical protein